MFLFQWLRCLSTSSTSARMTSSCPTPRRPGRLKVSHFSYRLLYLSLGKGIWHFLWKLTMPRMCPFLLTDHLKAFCRQFGSWFSRVWVLWCLQEAGGGPVPSQCNVTINDLMPTVPPWRPNIVIGQGIIGASMITLLFTVYSWKPTTQK